MKRGRFLVRFAVGLVAFAGLAACAAIAGIDSEYSFSADASADSAVNGDSSAQVDGSIDAGISGDSSMVADGANASDATITDGSAVDCTTMILASGLDRPSGIAIDAQYIYWVSNGSLMQIALNGSAGGSALKIADANDALIPTPVAVDSTNVYYASNSYVEEVTLEGGSSTNLLLSNPATTIGAIASDGTKLFFTEADGLYNGTAHLAKAGVARGIVLQALQGSDVIDFAAADSGTITECVVTSDQCAMITSNQAGINFVARAPDGGTLYWTTTSASGNTVDYALTATSPPKELVTINGSDQFFASIVADENDVYWLARSISGIGEQDLYRYSPDAGVTKLVTNQTSFNVQSLAIDSTSIYWSSLGTLVDGGAAADGGMILSLRKSCQ